MSAPITRVRDYPVFKVVIGGESGTGKTSMLQLASGKGISSHYNPTVGIDFHNFKFKVSDKPIHSIFFDMGGATRFKGVREALYKGTRCGVLMYDTSRPESLLRITEWYKEFREKAGGIPLLLVGSVNRRSPRKVKRETAMRVAKRLGATYLEATQGEQDSAMSVVKEAILTAARGSVVAH